MSNWKERVAAKTQIHEGEAISGERLEYQQEIVFSPEGNMASVSMGNIDISEAGSTRPYTTVWREAERIAQEAMPVLAKEKVISGLEQSWNQVYSREVLERVGEAQNQLISQLNRLGINVQFGSAVERDEVDLAGYYQRAVELASKANPNQTVLILDVSSYPSYESWQDKKEFCDIYPYLIVKGKPVLITEEQVLIREFDPEDESHKYKKEARWLMIGAEDFQISCHPFHDGLSSNISVIPGVQVAPSNNSISDRLKGAFFRKKKIPYSPVSPGSGEYPEKMRPRILEEVIFRHLADTLLNARENKKLRQLSRWTEDKNRSLFWQKLEEAVGEPLETLTEAISEMNKVQGPQWRQGQKTARRFKKEVEKGDISACADLLVGQFEDRLIDDEWQSLDRLANLSGFMESPALQSLAIECLSCGLKEIVTPGDLVKIKALDERMAEEYRTAQANSGYEGEALCDTGVPDDKKTQLASAGCGGRNSTHPFENTKVRAVITTNPG